MIGTLIGIIFVLIILGVIWWAIVQKLWPLIADKIAEPFRTGAYVLMVIVLVFVVLWIIAQILGMAGVHVKMPSL